jgi:cell division protein FtsI (penicillin-binding protein 3)
LKKIVTDFNAQGGSAVVLDVKTGEILAMVNAPSFNPNNRAGVKPQQMRNRAMVDVFEPGSTMKPLTVAAGLESGKWRPETIIDTNPGSINIQGKVLKDHNNYGVIDLTKLIAKSSQVGTVKIAMSLEPNAIRNMFHRFGMGQATGTGFPGESVGVLPSYQRWRDLDRATLAFGHGVSVTNLQLAQAYSVLANHGIRRPVSLLRQDEIKSGEQVLSDNVVRQLLPMMEAVTMPGGTGTRARVPGYRVAGKTGTVHKLGPGGYSADRYVAMFAGIAPVSDPRYAMAVMIDEPSSGKYFGGEVAAPVFGQLMQGVLQLMGIVPDDLQSLKPPLEKTADKNQQEKMKAPVSVGKVAA